MEREQLKSRLGFILLSAGCAIGIGNVWKFPYVAGQNGGGIFVLFYVIFLLIIGLPILTMEFAIGRASQKSPVKAFDTLEKKGHKWHIFGKSVIIGNYLLMMFYTTVSGWMLHYFYLMVKGEFVEKPATEVKAVFDNLMLNPQIMTFWMVIVVIIGITVCMLGVQKGLERITKYMMITLLIIMVILAINSCFMSGAKEGLSFYLLFDAEEIKNTDIIRTIVSAMNQAFFTLSLGIGSMAIFGSYIGKENTLISESVRVVILDTFVAITAGLIIFPACFTYGVDQASGPSLIFITLPNIFSYMPMGRFWGSLFFLFMSFAALSTIFAVFENIICCVMELMGWSRKKSAIINLVVITVLSLPCVFGFSSMKWDWLSIFGESVLDFEDFIVSNLFLPLGSFCFLIFCVSKRGWGWKNFCAEVNTGKGLKLRNATRVYLTYILPLIVLFLFVFGMYDKFLG